MTSERPISEVDENYHPSNTIGGIESFGRWKIPDGESYDVFVFGGEGFTFAGDKGKLNDMWQYSRSLNQWKFLKGSKDINQDPTYGDQDTYHSDNLPGARRYAYGAVINNNEILIFSGYGFYCTNPFSGGGSCFGPYALHEIWSYSITMNEWKSIRGGRNNLGRPDVPSPNDYDVANWPGTGYGFFGVLVSNQSEFFMIGNYGYSQDLYGYCNTIWTYKIATNEWKFLKGSYEFGNLLPIFGERNVWNDTNVIGGIAHAVGWNMNENVYLWSGRGFGEDGIGTLDNLWVYSISMGMWKFLHGKKKVSIYVEVYTRVNEYDESNEMSVRERAVAHPINSHEILLFGGSFSTNYFNTIWMYDININQLKFIRGFEGDICDISGTLHCFVANETDYNIKNSIGGTKSMGSVYHKSNNEMLIIGGYGISFDPLEIGFLNHVWSFNTNLMHLCFELYEEDEDVCSGKGKCVAQDDCHCNEGYVGDKCEQFSCFGIDVNETELVCNGKGECIDLDTCKCEKNYEGSQCEVTTCGGFDSSSPIACSSRGVCIDHNNCECDMFYGGRDCENLHELVGTTSFIVIGTMGVFFVLFACLIFCVCLLIICRKRIDSLFSKIKVFKELKDVELLLAEQKAEDDTSKPKVKVKTHLFVVDYKDIKVGRKIGQGGSGATVYSAFLGDKKVAYKVYQTGGFNTSTGGFDEFEREVTLLASLVHPNILQFMGVTLRENRIGFLMEFCENGDLSNFIKTFKSKKKSKVNHIHSFELIEKLRILFEIASAMKFLHSKKIIHRDLKCENVLLNSSLEAKVMDFGISKLVEDHNLTKTKRVGTAAYMSPQVALGEDYSEKCDVFAFSIIAFEVWMENTNPYKVTSEYGLERKVSTNPEYRPTIDGKVMDKWFVKMLMKCWAHEEKDRMSFKEICDLFKSSRNEIEGNAKASLKEGVEKTAEIGNNAYLLKKKIKELEEEVTSLKTQLNKK